MFKLIIADDEGKTTVVPLVRDEITVGRKEGNTIRLTERNVSRSHAKLHRKENGFMVDDMDSYNGVKLNGVPVLSPRPLNDGDQLTIGDYQLSFRSDRPAAAVAPPVPEAAEPPPHPRLVMMGPPEPGREFALTEAEHVIGRTDENSIVINHRSISRSHAKIIVDNGACRLHDLDSANGVRVNGEDYNEVELRRGDLVELGTVRLRYVGPGELYQFDADATVQMDALPDDLEPRRSPIIPVIIGLILVCLLGAGAYYAFTWPRDPGTGGATATPTPTPTPTPPPGPSLAEVKAQADDLIDRELYGPAIAALDSLGPTVDEEARDLRRKAVAEQEAHRVWRSACEDTPSTDVAAVHEICQRIDTKSRYRAKTCCGEAADRFGRSKISEARQHFRGREYDRALALANTVADDGELSDDVRDRARDLAERSQKRLDAAAPPASGPGPGPGPGPGKTPGKTITPRPPTPPPSTSKRRPAQEALAEAQQCVIRNDQACCIRALSGAERSGRVVNLLVNCYYRAGRTEAACRLARRYPRSTNCRQFVEARCR